MAVPLPLSLCSFAVLLILRYTAFPGCAACEKRNKRNDRIDTVGMKERPDALLRVDTTGWPADTRTLRDEDDTS